MPVTSQDFTSKNTDAATTEKLDMALAYLQQSPTAVAILELAALNGVQIGMNLWGTDHYGDIVNPGQDAFDAATHTVYWNPDSALQIKEMDGTIIGVQSAAIGLLHEIVHSIDPASLAHLDEKVAGYRNETEYTAIQYENMVAVDIGEPERDNHRGSEIKAENPTTHTKPTESGLVWAQIGPDGKEDYGSAYDAAPNGPEKDCPEFGSTAGNEHDHDPGNYPGNEHDSAPGNYPGNEHDADPGSYPGNEHDFDPGNGGGGKNDPLQQDTQEYDPLKAGPKPDRSHQTTHHGDHWGEVQLVGVAPPPLVDSIGFM